MHSGSSPVWVCQHHTTIRGALCSHYNDADMTSEQGTDSWTCVGT